MVERKSAGKVITGASLSAAAVSAQILLIKFARFPGSGWLILAAYVSLVVGLVILMKGLKDLPDRTDKFGGTHHRAQVLLICFGVGIVLVTAILYGLMMILVGFVGLFTLMIPLGFAATPFMVFIGTVLSLLLCLPTAIVGIVYVYHGVKIFVQRKLDARAKTAVRAA
jgi:hypothetical protein